MVLEKSREESGMNVNRTSNVEMLRILCMFAIILYHCMLSFSSVWGVMSLQKLSGTKQ